MSVCDRLHSILSKLRAHRDGTLDILELVERLGVQLPRPLKCSRPLETWQEEPILQAHGGV